MNFARLIALLALLACTTPGLAQAQTLPPDPSRLGADWRSYFVLDPEKDSETLASRIKKASDRLQAMKDQLPLDARAELAPMLDSIVANLRRYENFVGTELPVPPPAIAAKDSCSLAEVRENGAILWRGSLSS